MIIPHPLLGPRDAQEFVYLGDASLLWRPDPTGFIDRAEALAAMTAYVYERANPAGQHQELWYHEHGDRSWLIVTRDTVTHEILGAELAADVKRRGQEPTP
jgi:sarcosine oxidase subunit delta